MKITFYSAQPYDKDFFERHNAQYGFELVYLEAKLDDHTVSLSKGSDAVCVFVHDNVNRKVIQSLAAEGIRIIALRCAGFNNVDLKAASESDVTVVRVPAYSPHAVAEHALAMIMTLNRKTHKAYNRVREQNFSLNGLLGFDLYNKCVGVIGTGNIGQIFCQIMKSIGCKVLASDPLPNPKVESLGIPYKSLQDLLRQCDILSLHCPLNENTRHLINEKIIGTMKPGVMLINTSRGGLIDTNAVIRGLKSGQIGALGIDVYEQEENLFFQNLSESIIQDDVIARLMSFPNVLVTAHQGFFTEEALDQIADTTLSNLRSFVLSEPLVNEIKIVNPS
jgi:D-lactate dehydrogenase